jgi:hypothetical protein
MHLYTFTFTATAKDEAEAMAMVIDGTAKRINSNSKYVEETKTAAPAEKPKANDPAAQAMAEKLAPK